MDSDVAGAQQRGFAVSIRSPSRLWRAPTARIWVGAQSESSDRKDVDQSWSESVENIGVERMVLIQHQGAGSLALRPELLPMARGGPTLMHAVFAAL